MKWIFATLATLLLGTIITAHVVPDILPKGYIFQIEFTLVCFTWATYSASTSKYVKEARTEKKEKLKLQVKQGGGMDYMTEYWLRFCGTKPTEFEREDFKAKMLSALRCRYYDLDNLTVFASCMHHDLGYRSDQDLAWVIETTLRTEGIQDHYKKLFSTEMRAVIEKNDPVEAELLLRCAKDQLDFYEPFKDENLNELLVSLQKIKPKAA